jgi:hypothetical protein
MYIVYAGNNIHGEAHIALNATEEKHKLNLGKFFLC